MQAIKLLVRWKSNESGNIAILFSLMLIPLIGLIGLAVDFGQVLSAKTKAQVAADAAALQAAGVARDLITQSDGSEGATNAAIAEAKKRGDALFRAHAAMTGLGGWTNQTTVSRSGLNITANVAFTITSDATLGRLFGQTTYQAAGAAKSGSSLPSYADIYVATDISQSMGIGATDAEMKALFKVTKPSCVFGCHVPESGQSRSNSEVAEANKIRLRIDVIRDAIRKMIATAKDDAKNSLIYRFALYTMGANPLNLTSSKTTVLSGISGNFQNLDTLAQSITLGPNDGEHGWGDSYFAEPLSVLNSAVPTSGDGGSQAQARRYLFLLTDGVKDTVGSCTWGHCMGTIDPASCTSFKNRDIIVAVLYTTYLPIYKNPLNPNEKSYDDRYKTLVVNPGLVPLIAPKLKECASPGWFFEASDAKGIDEALKKMFEQTTKVPTLTN